MEAFHTITNECDNVIVGTYYRPQTKLREGNVFTPVYDSVHKGVSVQGSFCPGGLSPEGRLCLQGVFVWGGGVLSRGFLSKGSLSRGGSLSRAFSVQRVGGSLSGGGVSVRETPLW